MKNRRNITLGWQVFLLVTILFSLFIPNVSATELETESSNEITEDIYQETQTEETIEETTEEIVDTDLEKEEVTTPEDLVDTKEETEEIPEVEEKTREEIFTSYSKNMEFQKDVVTVKGNIQETTTVKDILENINIEELITNYSLEKVVITNEFDNLLTEEEAVTNLCKIVFISNDYIVSYQINFYGDLNQDNIITESDIETGINQFFEEKQEVEQEPIQPETPKNTITEEISYIDYVIENNTYEVEEPVEEDLNANLKLTDEFENYVEDEITVEFEIEGLTNNYINTISGEVIYNTDMLKLTNIYVLVDGQVLGNFKDNQFIYVLNVNKETIQPILKIEFQALTIGTANISIEQLQIIMNGTPLKVTNNTNLNIIIHEYGKGGDVEVPPKTDNITNSNLSNNDKKENTTVQTPTPTINSYSPQITPTVHLSNDNYIKNLEIIDHQISFDKETNYYSIDVENNIDTLNLNVTLNHENASYFITGNEQFKVGKNQIILTVFAEDGSTRDYVIEVNKKEQEEQEKETKPTTKDKSKNKAESPSKIHLIILAILIITTIILIIRLLKKSED